MRRAALVATLVAITACTEALAPADDPRDPGQFSRIVTLAPHLAELAFAAGAGDRLVGVSAYSDYPEPVLSLPIVSDAFTVDRERLALLEPDLLLAWESGMPASTISNLRAAGFRVEVIRTRGLDDIAAALRRIGSLAGTGSAGDTAARLFGEQVKKLREAHAGKRQLDVFFQVSKHPLYTINRDHYISELLDLCGGRNVFAELDDFAPNVDVEAVLARQPEVILSLAADTESDTWRRFATLPAVETDSFYVMPADEIGRPTPRVLIAAEAVCAALDDARQRRTLP